MTKPLPRPLTRPLTRPLPLLLALLLTPLLLAACGTAAPTLPPLAADAVILAFGDSLTHGTGARNGQGYPEVLSGLIGRKVVNAGIPGEESGEGLARLPGVLDRVKPQLLILCHGGNDMLRKRDLGQAADNLRQMVRLARERGIAVVLIGVPKPGIFLGTAEFYPQLAAELGVPLEGSALAEILGERSLKADAVHPNAEGYRHLADALRRLLAESGAV